MTLSNLASSLSGLTLADGLDAAAKAAGAVAGIIPGVAGVVFEIAAEALALGAMLAKQGKDPVIEIRRMHASDPYVKSVHDDWEKLIAERFHKKSDPPASTSTPDPDDDYPG